MGAVIEYFNPLFVLLGGLSLPVKVAWGAWLAWALGQLAWQWWTSDDSHMFRTTPATASQSGVRQSAVRQSTIRQSGVRQSGTRPVAVRPPTSVKNPAAAAAGSAPYGTSDFLSALDQEQTGLGALTVPDGPSPYR